MRLLQPSPSRSRDSLFSEVCSSGSGRLRNDGAWWRLMRGAERPASKLLYGIQSGAGLSAPLILNSENLVILNRVALGLGEGAVKNLFF
jgi:hypothetical protein